MLKGSGDAIGFIEAWEKAKDSEGDDGSQLEPSAGQKRKAEMSIPYLTPASKTARISSKEAEDAEPECTSQVDGKKMDEEIGKYFQGVIIIMHEIDALLANNYIIYIYIYIYIYVIYI